MAARLKPADLQRIVRALEVLDSTGVSLADWQRRRSVPLVRQAEAECYVILRDREGAVVFLNDQGLATTRIAKGTDPASGELVVVIPVPAKKASRRSSRS